MPRKSYYVNNGLEDESGQTPPWSYDMKTMKDYSNAVFSPQPDDYDMHTAHKNGGDKIFAGRTGIGWALLRFVLVVLFGLSHLIVAITFITFFVYVIAFLIINLLSLSLEMMTVKAPSRFKEVLLSIDVFFLTIFLTINGLMILSLFWEVIKVALLRRAIKFKVLRLGFVICVLIGSVIWVVVAQASNNPDSITDITVHDYVKTATKLSWCFALGICALGMILLRMKVLKTRVKGKASLVVYLITLCLALLFAILGPIFFVVVVDSETPLSLTIFTCVLPFVTAIMISMAYFRGKSKDNKMYTFNKGVCLFFIGLFFFTVISTTYLTDPESCSGSCRDKARQDLPKKCSHDSKIRYEICSVTWTKSQVSAAEVAFMANLTYNKAVNDDKSCSIVSNGCTILTNLTNNFFKKRSLLWNVTIHTKSERKVLHFNHKTSHIIAIKGPVTTKEFARDAKLWLEQGVLTALGSVLPFIEHLPNDFVSHFVSYSSVVAKIFRDNTKTSSFQELEQFVNTTKSKDNDVILVGHSLAGGIAKIIGARQQIPAVSFSSPGIANSHLKFQFSLKDALKTAVSISPEDDLFSELDKNAGIEQRIECGAKTPGKCHLITLTYCELHNVCEQGTAECEWLMDN